MNSISTSINNLLEYISLAMTRIFSPNEEPVPEVGVQPYDGEPYDGSSELE